MKFFGKQIKSNSGDIIIEGNNNVVKSVVISETPTPVKQNKAKSHKPSVFISYSWDDSEAATYIENSIRDIADVHIDRKTLEKGASITEYMKTIGDQDLVIVLLSDSYLKSESCMFEALELMKDNNWADKTICVVFSYDIFDNKTSRIEFWECKEKDCKEKIEKNSGGYNKELTDELSRFKAIKLNIYSFLETLSDRNCDKYPQATETIKNRIKII